MLIVAIALCMLLFYRDARSDGLSNNIIFSLVSGVLLWNILGARILYLLLHVEDFLSHPLKIFMVYDGGFNWQGGFVAGCVAGLWLTKVKNLSFPRMADLVAPYYALGVAVARIGCFLNGCCFGKEVSWGVYCPVYKATYIPLQLYYSVSLFILYCFLKYYQKKSTFPGQVFVLFLILDSLLRFCLDFVSLGYHPIYLKLSIYQWITLSIIITAIILYFYFKKRNERETNVSSHL